MSVNIDLRVALIKRFGSQVEATKQLGIRESKLSYILRGYAYPSERERDVIEKALGRTFVRKVLQGNSK